MSSIRDIRHCWYSCFLGKRCILVVKVGTAAKHLNNHVTVFRCHKLHHWISTLKCCVCVTKPVCPPTPPPPHPQQAKLCCRTSVHLRIRWETEGNGCLYVRWFVRSKLCWRCHVWTIKQQFYKTCWDGKVQKGPCRSSPSCSSSFYKGDEVEHRRGTVD